MAYSLDTNALLRWLLGDIPHQTKKIDELLAKKQIYHVADAAVIETAFVLEKVVGMPRDLVVQNIKGMLAVSNIACNRALFTLVLPLYEKYQAESFTDCCLAVYAHLQSAEPLLTFGKKLAKQLPYTELIA